MLDLLPAENLQLQPFFYKLLTFRGIAWGPSTFIWHSVIPLKHKVLLWLAFHGHLNTQDNMVKKQWKNIDHDNCDLCPVLETILIISY